MEAKEELNKKPNGRGEQDAMDAVLQHVGEMGRYQWLLFFCMMPLGLIFAFVYFGQMFIAATPQRHWCRVPELEHLDVELRRNLSAPGAYYGLVWDRCSTFSANWTRVAEEARPPSNDTPLVPCRHGWEFQLDDIPYHTVVSERGWVCEYSGNAPLAQSLFFAGSLCGGLLFGWLADRCGRVPALVGANLVGLVGGVASIFTSGLWDFVFCRFLVGMSYDSCFMMMYILVVEYVGPHHRTWVANMSIALYFGSGCLMLPWLALLVADWRRFLLVTSAPMILVLLAPVVVPESARWLASRGHTNRAVDTLRRFERVNNKKIPQHVMDEFILSCRSARDDQGPAALARSPPLRTLLVTLTGVYMACALVFDGLVRLSEALGGDFFITFTLTSATEIPSVLLLAFLLDRWGRRWLTCGPLTAAGVLSLIAAFVPKGSPQVSLAVAARFFMNMSYNAAIQWGTELMPTGVRAAAGSFVHAAGYIATVLSPYIVYSERWWQPLPLVALGAAAATAGGAGALLPETKGRSMPQTIADGERLFNQHSICGKPEDEEDSDWTTTENLKIDNKIA